MLESDNLTLNRTVEIALQVETAVECSNLLSGAQPLADTPTQQLQPTYHTHYGVHSPEDSQCCSEAGFPVQTMRKQNNRCTSEVCGNCGSKSHSTRAQHCPARGQKCRNCLKQNFAKMCHFALAALPPNMGSLPAHNNDTEIRNVTAGRVVSKNVLCS